MDIIVGESFYQIHSTKLNINCYVLRDLVLFVQFQKREKHPWMSDTFSKVATLLKVTLLHGCFSRFSNCTNSTKLRNALYMYTIFCPTFIRVTVIEKNIVKPPWHSVKRHFLKSSWFSHAARATAKL